MRRIALHMLMGDTGKYFGIVAGVSGASVTGSALTDMIQFWLGPLGYGPFLDRLRARGEP